MSQLSLFTRPGNCKSLSGCIFTTAFFFCFGLYALYKYALIDVESVLRKNLEGESGSFDTGEFGIDVSSLRAITEFQDEIGKPISKVDQWDAVVRKEEGVRMGYIADNCGRLLILQFLAQTFVLCKNKILVSIGASCQDRQR